jgi:hypothetical protein
MRSLILTLACLAGCGPEFAVIPKDGVPEAKAQAPMGVTMTAFANQWDSDPFDLADYVTPIAVELYNPGPYEVRVSLCDFALKDDRGTRFPAINPFVPLVSKLELEKPVLLAARGGGGGFRGGGHVSTRSSGYRGGGGVVIGPPSGHRLGFSGGVSSGRGWGGFYISGGLRDYYGPGALYWGGPFLLPPYYGTWVLGWGPGYYPAPRPSYDIVRFALPDGVLPAGAHVDGFLYFKKATNREHRALDLAWSLVDARSGADLGSLHVPLTVVDR